MKKPLEGRVALVTGASRGIGYATAIALAEAGAHIIAIARTQGGLEDLDDAIQAAGGTATLVPLDLTDFDAIDRLGAAIWERWKKLDILIGNAGYLGTLSPIGHFSIEDWQQVMDINVTANWRLLRSLDVLLRQSDDARALFLSSGAAHKCKPFWGLYSASKAALEAMVRTYAAETGNSTNVKTALVNPGATATQMRAKAVPGEDASTLPQPRDIAGEILKLCLPDQKNWGVLYDIPEASFMVPQMPVRADSL